MRKRKVLAFFGALLAFSLILGAMNLYNPDSITAKAISSDYEQELFVGNAQGFDFQPIKAEIDGSRISFKGRLIETIGEDHSIELTAYALDSQGVIAGQYQSSLFLAAADSIDFAANFDHDSAYPISELIFYFDDGSSVVKGAYGTGKSAVSGNVVKSISGGNGLFIYAIILASAIFMTWRYMRSTRREIDLASGLNEKRSRQFIDLDIR